MQGQVKGQGAMKVEEATSGIKTLTMTDQSSEAVSDQAKKGKGQGQKDSGKDKGQGQKDPGKSQGQNDPSQNKGQGKAPEAGADGAPVKSKAQLKAERRALQVCWGEECWLWLLIHWGWVTLICVSKLTTIGSANGWSVPSHYLNQCWNTVNSNFRNKLQWNLFMHFQSRKCIWKCRLRNGGNSVAASMTNISLHSLDG